MTSYEIMDSSYNILWEEIDKSKKEYITSKLGFKQYFYSTCISWMSGYLEGRKYYKWSDDYSERKTAIEAFQDTLKMETGINISKSITEKIINYLNNKKGEYYGK